MTPDEATIELYKYIYKNHWNSTVEGIQPFVEAGARLRDIETLYGPPLLYALSSKCSIPVLKYLIEKGGIDWNYKKGHFRYYLEDVPQLHHVSIMYNTIRNELLHLWHSCKGSYTIVDYELIRTYEWNGYSKEKYNKRLYRTNIDDTEIKDYKKEAIKLQEKFGDYPLQVCELFGVTPEELENGIPELPENTYDKSLLPKEDKSYCWNHIMEKKPSWYYSSDSDTESSDTE
jgi:hypothetical protein